MFMHPFRTELRALKQAGGAAAAAAVVAPVVESAVQNSPVVASGDDDDDEDIDLFDGMNSYKLIIFLINRKLSVCSGRWS